VINVYLLIFLIFANTMKNKKEIAVFVSSGIGNAVMLVPVMRLAQKQWRRVTIILNSPFISPEFLKFNNFPADEIIDLRKKNHFSFTINNINRFDEAYLDYSSSSIKNMFLASFISKKAFVYRKNKIQIPGIDFLPLLVNTHATVLHAKMINDSINEENFQLELMQLKSHGRIPAIIKEIRNTAKKIITIQMSSGNNKTKFKDWPVDYWIDFLNRLLLKYPDFGIILLGDENEVHLGNQVLKKIKNNRLISMIGKTTLREAGDILYNSDLYIGLDSGFMHLAVAYDIPTLTILGASNEQFIGYHKFNPKKHFVINKDLSCRPCHGWIGTNTSRVTNPYNCPDFKCLNDLLPEEVFNKFEDFISNISV